MRQAWQSRDRPGEGRCNKSDKTGVNRYGMCGKAGTDQVYIGVAEQAPTKEQDW